MDLEDTNYWKTLINMGLIRFLVLFCLNEEPLHGYAVLKKVQEFTRGCCSPTYGAIYPILGELVEGGYATVREDRTGGRKRKVYTLTSCGHNAYLKGLTAWQDILPHLNSIVTQHHEQQSD